MSALLPCLNVAQPKLHHDLVYAITTARQARDARLGHALARVVRRALGLPSALRARLARPLAAHRARRQLLQLDERQLRDIGLTRADVLREAEDLRPLSILLTYSAPLSAGVRHQRGRHGGASW